MSWPSPAACSGAMYAGAGRIVDLVDVYDGWMLEAGPGFRLGAQTGSLLRPRILPRQNHCQRDETIEPRLPRLVNDAHPAAADFAQEFIVPDAARRAIAA